VLKKKLRKSFAQGLSIAANRRSQLKAMEVKARELRAANKRLTTAERRNLYELRQELQSEVRLAA
jgi:hypothetical protein